MKIKELKDRFTELTGIQAVAKAIRSYTKKIELLKDLIINDLRRKNSWIELVKYIENLIEQRESDYLGEEELGEEEIGNPAFDLPFRYSLEDSTEDYFDFFNYVAAQKGIIDQENECINKKSYKNFKRSLLKQFHPDLNQGRIYVATQLTRVLNGLFGIFEYYYRDNFA